MKSSSISKMIDTLSANCAINLHVDILNIVKGHYKILRIDCKHNKCCNFIANYINHCEDSKKIKAIMKDIFNRCQFLSTNQKSSSQKK